MKELVCTPKRISLEKESPRATCLFIRPRVIMRCPRVWVRTRVEIFRSTLPARLINDIFERQDARRAWLTCVCAKIRRRDVPGAKNQRGSRARRLKKKKRGTPRSFDDYLSTSKLRNALSRTLRDR